MIRGYERFFSVDEIPRSRGLQGLYWALLVGFAVSFAGWLNSRAATHASTLDGWFFCPPWFQGCESWYPVSTLPESYGLETLFAILFATLTASAIAAYQSRWTLAHLLLWPATLWKLAYLGLFNYNVTFEFEYFHVPVVLAFLIVPRKLYFARRIWVLMCFLAAGMKFDDTWILGTYFTSLELGMPWVPDRLAIFACWAVIAMELVTPWLLLSPIRRRRLSALGIWLAFHVYSLILVGFEYPLYCVPVLLALFLPEPEADDHVPLRRKRELAGWAILAALFVLQSLPTLISGFDKKYTLQGKKFGVNMFIANYQCMNEFQISNSGGERRSEVRSSVSAVIRCDPYYWYHRLKWLCRQGQVDWRLLSSVNGGPFYEIVNQKNACALDYKIFAKNEWLRLPEEGAIIAGYPEKNVLRELRLWRREALALQPEKRIEPPPLAKALQPYSRAIAISLWSIWFLILLAQLARGLRHR
jgi:hypothetical protein